MPTAQQAPDPCQGDTRTRPPAMQKPHDLSGRSLPLLARYTLGAPPLMVAKRRYVPPRGAARQQRKRVEVTGQADVSTRGSATIGRGAPQGGRGMGAAGHSGPTNDAPATVTAQERGPTSCHACRETRAALLNVRAGCGAVKEGGSSPLNCSELRRPTALRGPSVASHRCPAACRGALCDVHSARGASSRHSPQGGFDSSRETHVTTSKDWHSLPERVSAGGGAVPRDRCDRVPTHIKATSCGHLAAPHGGLALWY